MNLPHLSLASFGYGQRLHPMRDWFVILGVFLLGFALVLVWNLSAFSTVAAGGVIGGAATSTPPVFNPSSLTTIHTLFANRATEEAKYLNGVYQYADPSR